MADSASNSSRGIVFRVLVPVVAIGGISIASAVMMTGGESNGAILGTADTAAAQNDGFLITTLASGELVAKNRVELRSKVESTTSVVEVVAEGTRVNKGDLLVKLSSESIESEIEEEELRVIEATTAYEAAQTAEKIQISDNSSALLTAEAELTIAKLSLDQWKDGDVAKERLDNQLEVEKAEKNLTRLSDKYDQSRTLFAQEFLSKDELDRDEITFIEAKATLEKALLAAEVYETYQFEKDKTEKALDVEQATAKLDRVREENDINLKDKQARTISNQRQLQMRQERLDKYRAQLEACTILAPSDGLVVYGTSTESGRYRAENEGSISVGTQVRNNDLLLVLPDTTEMIANVKVHESLAGRIRPGQTAMVTIEAIDAVVPGMVDSIGILAESSGWRDPNLREYTVKIAIDPGEIAAKIKPTMRCEAEITLGEVTDAMVIPLPAVFNDGAIRFVYVPSGSRFVRQPVSTGQMSDTDVEIVAGLALDQMVLLREPDAGEVLSGDWDPEQLKAAGYMQTEDGIWYSPSSSRRGGRPGSMPAGASPDGVNTNAKPGGRPQGSKSGSTTGQTIVTPAKTEAAG